MDAAFYERVEEIWTAKAWMFDDMFRNGMCFFEGYIPSIAINELDTSLPQLTDSSIDCRYSTWASNTTESDWNRSYPIAEYISFFRTGRIAMLHADLSVAYLGIDWCMKLIFEQEANLEVIVYRENLLPRTETHSRFVAACRYLCHLQSVFRGEALFVGPDTLNYPVWPDAIPDEWHRLV